MSHEETPDSGPSRPHTARILVVDDDVEIGTLLRLLLIRDGHACDYAEDGCAAWDLLSKDISQFDLIITDHNMPRLDGLGLVQHLRAADFHGKIIVHSSSLTPDIFERYRKLGVSTFVEKPFETRRILEMVRAAVRSRGVRAEQSRVAGKNGKVAKILVAAVPEVREFFERALAGHELAHATTRVEAQRLLSKEPFELIVCTVAFDDADMLELLRLTKSHPDWRTIPFVCARVRPHVLPSPGEIEAAHRASRAMGAAAFLNVPAYRMSPGSEMRTAIDELLIAATKRQDN
jgi:CheY-like chemotaxis protein